MSAQLLLQPSRRRLLRVFTASLAEWARQLARIVRRQQGRACRQCHQATHAYACTRACTHGGCGATPKNVVIDRAL